MTGLRVDGFDGWRNGLIGWMNGMDELMGWEWVDY